MAKQRRVSLKKVFLSEAIDQFDLDQENLLDKGPEPEDKDGDDDGSVVLTLNYLVKDAAGIVSYKAEELGIDISDESVENAIEEVLDFAFDEFGEVTAWNLESGIKELSKEERVQLVEKIKDLAAKKMGIANEELQHSQTAFVDTAPAVVKEDEEILNRRAEARGYRLQDTIAKMENLMRKHVEYHMLKTPGKKADEIFTPVDLADDLERELMLLDRGDEIDYDDILDMADEIIREMSAEKPLMEKAPPGMEDVVLALKKKFGEDSPRPFQIAWSQYNEKHGKKKKKSVNEAGDPVDMAKHLKVEAMIEKEMRKALRLYETEVVVPGKRIFDMASDLVDLVQGEIYDLDSDAVLSHQDYLDMAYDLVSELLDSKSNLSSVEVDKNAKMDRMDLDSEKFDLMEEGEEEISPQHRYEKALAAVRTANSYVTHDDPNMAFKMSSIARDYAKQMRAPELYNTDVDELADELVAYFISNMTDENPEYQEAMLEPDDRYSSAAEAAGMHREEAYVFSKFPKRLLARAITEFYSR